MHLVPSARRLLCALLVAGAASPLMHGQQTSASPPQPPIRYDLQPGDHAVYRERLDRRVVGEESEEHVIVEWTTHLLATGPCPGCVVVGTQRTRTSASLLRSVRGGRNVTTADRKAFDDLLPTRPSVLADANWVDPAGASLLPTTVAREWRSLLLPGVREIEPLPERGVSPGDSWPGRNIFNLKMTATACAPPGDADCLLIEGKSGASRLRAWLARAQPIVTKLSVSGEYDSSGNLRVREEITFELAGRRRGERIDDWLSSPETRAGALAALRISPSRPLPAERLYALLDGADEETERQVLAVAWQWHAAPPAPAVVARLIASPNARVRALAARLAGRPAVDPASAPDEAISGPSRRPTACAAAVERWTQSRRFGWQQPGATLRPMSSAGFAGWPYVLRVPDDYTGEDPTPLIVYLSGGPGLAISGAQTAERALAGTGYLAVFPQANGLWWDERPHQVVHALLDEVVRAFNVDTNRIYIAGFSNGGTGTLVFAARWPDRFAAAAPTMPAAVGGGLVPSFVSGLNTLPLLLQHGTSDRVIPVDQAAENRRQLGRQSRTAPFDVVLLEGRGHDVNISTDDGRTLSFLAGRRRDPFPRTIVFETPDLAAPRRYWIEITGKDNGVARVEARVLADGAFDITTKNVRGLRLLLRGETLPLEGPVVVRVNGREAYRAKVTEDCGIFARSLEELSDPGRAYSAAVELDLTLVRPGRDGLI